MTREVLVSFLGLIVALVPFLGIPRDIKDWIFAAMGTLIVLFGISLRHSRYLRSVVGIRSELRSDMFPESSRQAPANNAPRSRSTSAVPENL